MTKYIIEEESDFPSKRPDTLIPGDIHLGSNESRTVALRKYIKHVKPSRIVFQGDTFDKANLRSLPKKDQKFLNFIRTLEQSGVEIVWVHGNHDQNLGALLRRFYKGSSPRVHREYTFNVNDRNFLVFHGDDLDRVIFAWPILTAIATWFHNMFQRFGGEEQIVARWLKSRTKRYLKLADELDREALEIGIRDGFDVVIIGHTHRQSHISHTVHNDGKEKQVHLFNCGCWTDPECGIVAILQNGQVENCTVQTRLNKNEEDKDVELEKD